MLSFAYKQAKEAVEGAQHILLMTDERSDGDTFGSSLAFRHYLEDLGKQVTHYASAPVLETLRFLPGMEHVTRDQEALTDPTIDLVVVFDSSREAFVKALVRLVPRRVPLLVFDHHQSNTCFGDVNVVNPGASSTCEVVLDYLQAHHVPLHTDLARCLMVGMLTDTGLLTNDTTPISAFEKASTLFLSGGTMKDVVQHVTRSATIEQLQLWGRVLERLVIHPEERMAVAYVTQEDLDATGAHEQALSELSDYLGATLDVTLVLLLKDLASRPGVKVSMRAHGVDSTRLSGAFPGGGGHPGASGFTVQGTIQLVDGIPQIV